MTTDGGGWTLVFSSNAVDGHDEEYGVAAASPTQATLSPATQQLGVHTVLPADQVSADCSRLLSPLSSPALDSPRTDPGPHARLRLQHRIPHVRPRAQIPLSPSPEPMQVTAIRFACDAERDGIVDVDFFYAQADQVLP
jgi:hypothetical protein